MITFNSYSAIIRAKYLYSTSKANYIYCTIKIHGSELQGQEEAASTHPSWTTWPLQWVIYMCCSSKNFKRSQGTMKAIAYISSTFLLGRITTVRMECIGSTSPKPILTSFMTTVCTIKAAKQSLSTLIFFIFIASYGFSNESEFVWSHFFVYNLLIKSHQTCCSYVRIFLSIFYKPYDFQVTATTKSKFSIIYSCYYILYVSHFHSDFTCHIEWNYNSYTSHSFQCVK